MAKSNVADLTFGRQRVEPKDERSKKADILK